MKLTPKEIKKIHQLVLEELDRPDLDLLDLDLILLDSFAVEYWRSFHGRYCIGIEGKGFSIYYTAECNFCISHSNPPWLQTCITKDMIQSLTNKLNTIKLKQVLIS